MSIGLIANRPFLRRGFALQLDLPPPALLALTRRCINAWRRISNAGHGDAEGDGV